MGILDFSYLDSLKRFWRRKKYQRLGHATTRDKKMKLGVVRLGNKEKIVVLKRKQAPIKLHWKLVSPLKLVTNFHNAYVNTMIGSKKLGISGVKRVPSGKPVPVVASSNNYDVVDCRMVLEMYKRIVSSRELAHILI